MSSEKRLVLTLVLTIGSVYGIQYADGADRPDPAPAAPAPAAVAKVDPAKAKAKAKAEARDDRQGRRRQGRAARRPVRPRRRRPRPPSPKATRPTARAEAGPARRAGPGLGQDDAPSAYHLRLQLDQKGAAVAEATSARYDAESTRPRPRTKGRLPRLKLIGETPGPTPPARSP